MSDDKLGKMVTYLDRLLPVKSHDVLITWFWKITWQPKIIISLLPQCLWRPNLTSWWFAMRGFYWYCFSILCSRDLARSHNRLKSLYFNYLNIYSHKTRQDTDLPWLPLSISQMAITTRLCEITWQTKNSVYRLPQYLWQ